MNIAHETLSSPHHSRPRSTGELDLVADYHVPTRTRRRGLEFACGDPERLESLRGEPWRAVKVGAAFVAG